MCQGLCTRVALMTGRVRQYGWLFAALTLCLILGGTFAEGLLGTKSIDGAAILPHEDALYGPAAIRVPLPGRGGEDPTPELYNQPWDTLAWREIAHGQLPVWQPYNAFGKPLIAGAQEAPLDPLKVVFAWTGARGVAESWYLVSLLAIGGIGALLLARRFGLGPLEAILVGSAYMLNGQFMYHLQYTDVSVLVLLPWLVWAAQAMIDAPNASQAAIFGLAIGAAGLMGHPEPALLAAMAAVLLVLLAVPGSARKGRLLLALTGALGLAMATAGCTLLPFLELVRHSDSYILHSNDAWLPGKYFTIERKLWISASNAITGTALHYWWYNPFVGTAALCLAPLGLASTRLRLAVTALWSVPLFVICFGVPGQHLAPLALPLHAPYASALVALGLALSGGAGLSLLRTSFRGRTVALAGLAAVVIIRIAMIGGGLVGERVFLVSAGLLAVGILLAGSRHTRIALSLIVTASIFQLCWNARLINPPQPRFDYQANAVVRFLQQRPGPFRVAGGFRALLPDSNVMYGIDSLESYEVFNVERYARFMGALIGTPCGSLQETGLTTNFAPALLSLANVRYLLVPDPQPKHGPWAKYPICMRAGHLAVRENATALPRAWVSYAADFVADERSASARLSATPDRWLTHVLLETPGGRAPAGWRDASAPVTDVPILQRRAQSVALEAVLSRPGWLVLSDLYYPGWQATVDGRPSQVLPADVAFRAVYLPPGRHRIVFRYRSPVVALGFSLSLAAILLGLLLALTRWLPSVQAYAAESVATNGVANL